MENNPADWRAFWKKASSDLDAHVNRTVDVHADRFLFESLGLLCFSIEEIDKKITKNREVYPRLDVPLVVTVDLCRASLNSYRCLSIASVALTLRAALEVHANLKFIVRSDDPTMYADRYCRFLRIETLMHRRRSKNLSTPSAQEEAQILDENPEWRDKETGKLVKRPHWTGIDGYTFESVARKVGLSSDYDSMYVMTSKFSHGSSLLLNMYRKSGALTLVPCPEDCMRLSMMATNYCMDTFREYADFFGIPFPDGEYKEILRHLLPIAEIIAPGYTERSKQ